MMRLFSMLLLFPLLLHGEGADTSGVSFFPGGLQFLPLRANHEEPRMGLVQEIGAARLTVFIGNGADLLEIRSGAGAFRIGADFLAYAKATTFGKYRFKIDAADGIFGLHASYRWSPQWEARLRALHYSAHLVDGHYDDDDGVWRTERVPIPFSRNYGDLTIAHRPFAGDLRTRVYGGIGVSVYNNPHDIQPFLAHAGAELATGSSVHWYLAAHFSLSGVPTYRVSNTTEAGIKFGRWEGPGMRVFLLCRNGADWHGEYYKEVSSVWGVGFMLEY